VAGGQWGGQYKKPVVLERKEDPTIKLSKVEEEGGE